MKSLANLVIVSLVGAVLVALPLSAEDKTPPTTSDAPKTTLQKGSRQLDLQQPGSRQSGVQQATPQQPTEAFWIGVRVAPVPGVLLPQFGAKEDGPGRILVEQVLADGPAAKAGLKRGDVILKFSGTEIHCLMDLVDQVAKAKATAQPMVVLREGKNVDLTITPGQRPAMPVEIDEEGLIEGIPGVQIDPRFPRNFRNPQRTMRQMENMLRQMQGGVDDGKAIVDEDTVSETDDLTTGKGTRIEVKSHTGEDGKKQVHVTKTTTTDGKPEKKSWIVEKVEDLPGEIKKDVEALFGGGK